MRVPELLPLFPLPDQVLLPGLPARFRIFEPRYRALAGDLLKSADGERWLAIPRLKPGWEGSYEGSPAIQPIAAAALARRIEPQDNGEYHILVEGIVPCELAEVPSPDAYRLARARVLDDLPEPRESLDSGMQVLLDQLASLGDRIELRPPELAHLLAASTGHAQLVYRLGALLLSVPDERQELLECRIPSVRMELVRRALGALGSVPRPPVERWKPSAN